MNDQTDEITGLKAALHDTWSAGDYGLVASGLERSAGAFLDRMRVSSGQAVLDVACGTGQLAIPAARAGARVTGVDISAPWINQADRRARAEGLAACFDVGDVESLPYDSDEFDTVISLIGAMFAPRPALAASEMLRVCQPGGRIIMGNWTAEGFVGDFFRLVGGYSPPPDMPSPLLWGDEDTVRQRFADGVSELRLDRSSLHFDYPMAPPEVARHYCEHFGPTRKVWESLDQAGQGALQADLTRLWGDRNQADDGTTQVDAEILEIVAVRR